MSDSHKGTLLTYKKVFKFKDLEDRPVQNQRNKIRSPLKMNHNFILTCFYQHYHPMEPEVKNQGQPVMSKEF